MIVEDNGVGISDDLIDLVFQDYSRLDENKHLNVKGTGLGLSICKNIVQEMNGEIKRPQSITGQGTIFDIHFNFYALEPIIDNQNDINSQKAFYQGKEF